MKSILSLLALGVAFAVTAPAFAEDAAPTTQADCQKTAGMEWDADTGTCVEQSPGG